MLTLGTVIFFSVFSVPPWLKPVGPFCRKGPSRHADAFASLQVPLGKRALWLGGRVFRSRSASGTYSVQRATWAFEINHGDTEGTEHDGHDAIFLMHNADFA